MLPLAEWFHKTAQDEGRRWKKKVRLLLRVAPLGSINEKWIIKESIGGLTETVAVRNRAAFNDIKSPACVT